MKLDLLRQRKLMLNNIIIMNERYAFYYSIGFHVRSSRLFLFPIFTFKGIASHFLRTFSMTNQFNLEFHPFFA